MLDARDHGGIGTPEFMFIDPDIMARLRPLLQAGDEERVTLIERIVQDVPLGTFAELSENDVLFVDSSHVSKIGSDVSWRTAWRTACQAPRHVASILDAARELGIRDAQVGSQRKCTWILGLAGFRVVTTESDGEAVDSRVTIRIERRGSRGYGCSGCGRRPRRAVVASSPVSSVNVWTRITPD